MATRNCGRPPLGCRSDIFCREKQSAFRDEFVRCGGFLRSGRSQEIFFRRLCTMASEFLFWGLHSESSTSNSWSIFSNLYSAIWNSVTKSVAHQQTNETKYCRHCLTPAFNHTNTHTHTHTILYLWYCKIYQLICTCLLLFLSQTICSIIYLKLFGEFEQKLPSEVSLHRCNRYNIQD